MDSFFSECRTDAWASCEPSRPKILNLLSHHVVYVFGFRCVVEYTVSCLREIEIRCERVFSLLEMTNLLLIVHTVIGFASLQSKRVTFVEVEHRQLITRDATALK